MCEKLYDLDLQGALVPQLATAMPEVSEDGLTVTIPSARESSSMTARRSMPPRS